jgi:hypothetical protein
MEEFKGTPLAVLAVAFQPTARGGSTHFTAGNIRIVSQARILLAVNERVTVEKSAWMAGHLLKNARSKVEDDDWVAWLESELETDEDDAEEKLIVNDQLYYTCPRCNTELL